MGLQLLGVIASGLGWDGFDDLEDPADLINTPGLAEASGAAPRATDPAARAAQIAAFLAAAG
jgi:hypothetical protein